MSLNLKNFIADLEELVSINSEKASAKKGMPFGKNNSLALSKFIDVAKRMGFSPINHDNYLAEFSVGDGEEIGIIGHLDVVPVGSGWNTHPFTLTKIDNVYYGRGVHDDKGPTLLALYALKDVVDSGVSFKRKIRFFAGTNEESGWEDIEYFKNVGGTFPKYGFSPDGNFPLSYAEKGIYPTEFTIPAFEKFSNLKGGLALNAVCDYATVKPLFTPNKADLDKFGLSFDGEVIISKGVSAHGSTPRLGVNAFKAIFEYMLSVGERVQNVYDCLFNDKHGVFKMVSEQGEVTLSPNVITSEKNVVKILCDVRVPAPFTQEQLKQKFNEFELQYTMQETHPPMLVEKEGWFVQTLLNAYNTVTKQNAKPISMGGSTYARAFEMGCAFGAGFPNANNGAHEPNEHFSEEEMLLTYEIYKNAILNLVK